MRMSENTIPERSRPEPPEHTADVLIAFENGTGALKHAETFKDASDLRAALRIAVGYLNEWDNRSILMKTEIVRRERGGFVVSFWPREGVTPPEYVSNILQSFEAHAVCILPAADEDDADALAQKLRDATRWLHEWQGLDIQCHPKPEFSPEPGWRVEYYAHRPLRLRQRDLRFRAAGPNWLTCRP